MKKYISLEDSDNKINAHWEDDGFIITGEKSFTQYIGKENYLKKINSYFKLLINISHLFI